MSRVGCPGPVPSSPTPPFPPGPPLGRKLFLKLSSFLFSSWTSSQSHLILLVPAAFTYFLRKVANLIRDKPIHSLNQRPVVRSHPAKRDIVWLKGGKLDEGIHEIRTRRS